MLKRCIAGRSLATGILMVGLAGSAPFLAAHDQLPTPKPDPKSSSAVASAEIPSSSTKNGKTGTGLATPSTTATPASTSSTPADSTAGMDLSAYRVGIDDELQISVWKEPELSGPVAVRPDGMITLPLLNDIRVVGLSTKELQASLEEKLKAFVNEPQVTIIVRLMRSRRVYLIGSVGRKGPVPLTGNMTVLQLLSEAGGLGPFAKTGSIHILRNVNGRQIRIPFNYKKAVRGESARSEDILLVPGDMVVVP